MNLEQIKLAVTLDNGDLSITSFLTVGRGNNLPACAQWVDRVNGLWKREPTDVAILDELCRAFPEKDLEGNTRPQATRFRRIADSDLPLDRTYRAAWRDDGTKIVHDMPKARDIHLARMRSVRSARLLELDGKWMRAFGTGDTKEAKRIETDRQVLRDLPTTIGVEKAATVERLKLLWPAILTS